jgi:hypothetical protein
MQARQWSVRLAAARDVLDRLHGKAGQPMPGGVNTLADLLPLAQQYTDSESHEDSVLVIGGDTESYLAALRRVREKDRRCKDDNPAT